MWTSTKQSPIFIEADLAMEVI